MILKTQLEMRFHLSDADTQACISGALAEAYYLNIPKPIKEFVISRITPEMLMVLNDFNQRVRVVIN